MTIICIGHSCIDHYYYCQFYPIEDSKTGSSTKENRCLDHTYQRGGNASNNCTVLGLLNANPSYFGTIANALEKDFIISDFESYGIDISNAIFKDGCSSPNSVVIIAKETGSRTIIHSNKDLPEVSLDEFTKLDFEKFHWYHFEGRNEKVLPKMLKYLAFLNEEKQFNITISVEVEKINKDMDAVIPLADVLFFSKEFALSKGFKNKKEAVVGFKKLTKKGSLIICAWGEDGAACSDGLSETVYDVPATAPLGVIDTLGAGDSFNAATIYALSKSWPLEESVAFGCSLAGIKVGTKGWAALREVIRNSSVKEDLMKRFPRLSF